MSATNNIVSKLLRVALAFIAAAAIVAQTEHITSFTGVWKLDATKSTFNPGPPFQSFTLTFTADGVRHLDLIAADGQAVEALLPWSDGTEVVVVGIPDTKTTSKIQNKIFHDIWKRDGKVVEDVHGSVSPDGKTLQITVDGTDASGHDYHNRLTFNKQ